MPTVSVPYKQLLDELRSREESRQNSSYQALIKATDVPVNWAYEIWDDLIQILADGDNRQRSICSQVLSNLAKSDPNQRMVADLPILFKVTKDERFVTARHCLQSLWKIGVAGDPQRQVLLKGLSDRFKECVTEKNCTLIRYDILVVLRRVYDLTADEQIQRLARELIATEQDLKYQKKYVTVWPASHGSPRRSLRSSAHP